MSRENNKKILPKNWIDCKIKDVGEIIAGGTPSTSEPSYWGDEVSWITPADLSGYKSMYISKGRKSLSKKGLQNSSARLIPKGSVLFSSRAPIGYVVVASNELATNQGFKNIVPYSGIDSKYLYYYLIANKQLAEENASGTTFKEISATKFAELPLVLAPSNEQVRISDKLDELLSELEKGKEQLQTSLEQLKVYRQSILKHAFENTKRVPVGDLYDFIGGGTPSKKNTNYWKGNIPWASVKDIKGDFLNKTQDKISEAGLKDSASNLAKPNDIILITRIVPGRPIIAKIETAINQDLKIVKPKIELIPRFIYYSFKSIERECLKVSSGTTVLGINLVKLKEISIPYLELKEQELVVQEIDRRLSECDKLEETLLQSLSQAEVTKKSLLQKAFEGKLVEQDPTDEPASLLLERIKKEREKYIKAEKEKKKNQKKPMKKKSAAKVFEFPLIDTIKDKFGKKSFTFDQLKSEVDINYDDLREELFSLLDNEKVLTMEFDSKKETMKFNYIGK